MILMLRSGRRRVWTRGLVGSRKANNLCTHRLGQAKGFLGLVIRNFHLPLIKRYSLVFGSSAASCMCVSLDASSVCPLEYLSLGE